MAVLESWDFVANENVTGDVAATTIAVANTAPGSYRDATGLLVFAASNTPRIDYDSSGTCLGLLIEETCTQRGGAASQEDFTSGWIPGDVTVTSNAETGPDGVAASADTIRDKGDATSDTPLIQSSAITTPGSHYVMSVFVKKITGHGWCYLQLANHTSSTGRAWFNLNTGVVGSLDSGMVASGIEAYANGWYRVWAALDATNVSGLYNIGLCNGDLNTTYSSNGSKIAVRYYQVEIPPADTAASCQPTSYRTGNRSADVTTFSTASWYDDGLNTGNFSFYAEYDAQSGQDATAFYIRSALDTNTYMQAGWYLAPAQARWWMMNNPGNDGTATASTLNNDGSIERIAGAITNANQRLSVNGGTIGTDATADYPLSDVVSGATIKYCGQSNVANSQLNGHMRVLVFSDDMWDDTTLTDYTTNGYSVAAPAASSTLIARRRRMYQRREHAKTDPKAYRWRRGRKMRIP